LDKGTLLKSNTWIGPVSYEKGQGEVKVKTRPDELYLKAEL